MKNYLEKLATDYDKALEFLASPFGEKQQNKITGRLIPGAKCAWCYEDDVKFWKEDEQPYPHPKDWPYQGFIIPFPETNGRGEMEAEHVCVIIVDYPIEKENPVTDWAVLACLLEVQDLHRFYVFEQITTHPKGE
jgi:hypothetical protein